MAISRQSDSIWVTAAMGEGRQDRTRSDTHDAAVHGSRNYGHSLGVQHASEAWRTENRDAHGRFAPTAKHDEQRHHEEGRQPRGDQRDKFMEGYHTGFTSHIHSKEREKKQRSSSLIREAIEMNPYTRRLHFDDGLNDLDKKYLTDEQKEDRFRYYLNNGTYEGWKPESPMDKSDRTRRPEDDYVPQKSPSITDRNPAAIELNRLQQYTDSQHGIPLTDKHPFSAHSYAVLNGQDPGRKSKARGKLPKGSLASEPMQMTDRNGVKHTFWHQVSTEFPVDNPEGGVDYSTEYPGAKMSKYAKPRLTIAMHHHRSDTGLQLPLVSNHTLSNSDDSTSREADLNGAFRTNDQTRALYDLGAQRTGDWNNEIKFHYNHPNGQIQYDIQRVNGNDSRYRNNSKSGMYYDPELGSKIVAGQKHPDYVGEQWAVTPKTMERLRPHDPQSEMRRVAHNPIMFRADDAHGFNDMIQHVLSGQGANELGQPYGAFQQHQMPNNGGLPPAEFSPRSGSIRPWAPEHNIHRSAERLPIDF